MNESKLVCAYKPSAAESQPMLMSFIEKVRLTCSLEGALLCTHSLVHKWHTGLVTYPYCAFVSQSTMWNSSAFQSKSNVNFVVCAVLPILGRSKERESHPTFSLAS